MAQDQVILLLWSLVRSRRAATQLGQRLAATSGRLFEMRRLATKAEQLVWLMRFDDMSKDLC